jgi:hypothetical protein
MNVVLATSSTDHGLYHACGAMRVTVVDGTSLVPCYAPNGSLNVISGVTALRPHASGAMQLAGLSAPVIPFSLFTNGEDGAIYDVLNGAYAERDAAGGGTTRVTTDGTAVGTLRDLSGNGNHLVAPSDAARPIYKVEGALAYIEFDKTDDSMDSAMVLTQPWARVSALKHFNTTTGARRIYASSTAGHGNVVCNAGTYAIQFTDDGTASLTLTTIPTNNANFVLSEARNGVSSFGQINQTAADVLNIGANGLNTFRVNMSSTSTQRGGVKLYSCVIVNRVLTAGELSDLQDWAAASAGVSL